MDDDELPELMRREAERQAAEADGNAAEEADAEAERQERTRLSEDLLSKMPSRLRQERPDVFNDTPIDILRKFKDSVAGFVAARGGAYHQGGIVHIKRDPNDWSGTRNTLHHECGHAALRTILGTYGRDTQIPDALNPIMDAAKRETEALARRAYGEEWRTAASGQSYGAVAHRILGLISEESEYFSKTTEERNEFASFCDLMHSATKGAQFFGHGRSYYSRNGDCSALHEIVADATAILSGPMAAKGEELFPDTLRAVKEIVYGMTD